MVSNITRRVIIILILYNQCPFLILSQKTQNQWNNDSIKIATHELAGVLVIAGRTPVAAHQSSRMVSVITKSEIENTPVQDLNDMLRYVEGVDIRQRGAFGVQADIGILGGTFDQTLILLNGVNVNDPQTGHHNLNLPVDIESIERIEVLKGPAAKSFGANAFSGAINIITGNSKKNFIGLSTMAGQHGLYVVSANSSLLSGKFEHFINLSRKSSNGYIKNTDFTINNLFYQTKYYSKAGSFDFQTGLSAKEFGANSFYSLKYPDQFEAVKTEFASLKFQSKTAIIFSPVIYLRRKYDRFELIRDNQSIPFNHHKTTTAGLTVNVRTTHRFGKTSLGLDLRNEHILSNVLGIMLNKPVEVRGYNDAFYTKYYNRIITGFYAEHNFSLKKLTLNAGILANYNSDIKVFGFYPGIDIGYRFNSYISLYTSANKTLRMPTFTDMFYKSPVQQGNPLLKPEEAVTMEGGIKYNNSFLKGNISTFRRRGYNMIDWVKDPSPNSIIWRSMNHTKINFTGFECSVTLSPSTFERIQLVRLSYSFIQADLNHNNVLSKYSLDYLKHQITASFDFRLIRKLYYSGRLTYRSRNGNYQDAGGQIVSYYPFWMSDIKISWKENQYKVYAEASNIFNSRYYDFGGIIQPGVWIKGGIAVDIDYRKNLTSGEK